MVIYPVGIRTRKMVIVALLAILAAVVYFFYPATTPPDRAAVKRPVARETPAQPALQTTPTQTATTQTAVSPEVSRLQREKELLRDEYAQVLMEKTALSARLQEMEGRLPGRTSAGSGEAARPGTVSLIEISVVDIQEDLAGLGYRPGPIDGRMGPMTRNAIREFHDDLGMTASQMSLSQLFMTLETYKEVQLSHKDWQQVYRNDTFRSWLSNLPQAEAARYKSTIKTGTARDIVELLNNYKLERRAG